MAGHFPAAGSDHAKLPNLNAFAPSNRFIGEELGETLGERREEEIPSIVYPAASPLGNLEPDPEIPGFCSVSHPQTQCPCGFRGEE